MNQLQLSSVSKEIIDHAEAALVPSHGLTKVVDDYFIQRLKQDEMQHAEVDPRLYEGLRTTFKAEVLPLYEQFRLETARVRERKARRKLWRYVLGTVGVCELLEAILTRGRSIAPQVLIPSAILYCFIGFILFTATEYFDDRQLKRARQRLEKAIDTLDTRVETDAEYDARRELVDADLLRAEALEILTHYEQPEAFWRDYLKVRAADAGVRALPQVPRERPILGGGAAAPLQPPVPRSARGVHQPRPGKLRPEPTQGNCMKPSSPLREPRFGAKPPGSPVLGLGGLLRQARPAGLTLLLVLVALFLLLLYATCTQYIHPDEFAIKQVDVPVPLLTGAAGLHTNVYTTGIRWLVPGCEKFILFPRSIRAVTLRTPVQGDEESARYVHYEEPAHIQTSDGFFINLDVSILYRVVDPYKVVREFGAGSLYEQNGILMQAEPTFKATMGTLRPEDFFNAANRVAKQEETRDKFNEFLVPRGLKVEHVLIRYPKYHEAVQARIEARNIQEQTRQKNIEETKLAQANADLNEVVKQGEASLTIKLMEGSNYVTRLTAAMDAYQRKKASEGNRIIAVAEAEKQRMVNDAYQGEGADRLIGLQWAKVLSGLDTIVLESGGPNGFNPLDMQSLMKHLKLNPSENPVTPEKR